MKKLNLGVVLAMIMAFTGCAMAKKKEQQQEAQTVQTANQQSGVVQTDMTEKNQFAFDKATSLTNGWPETSTNAAREMITKYGTPHEVTSDKLIWRNVAPFREIIVHKVVYLHRFPLLHQNSLEHVVDYSAKTDKVDDVLRFNGSIVFNRTKGQMSSSADSEAMNFLALNLADMIIQGRMGSESARVKYGKETLNYMNGNANSLTQILAFGGQYQTADQGETVTNKIRWIGDSERRTPVNVRQAQEEKPVNKK